MGRAERTMRRRRRCRRCRAPGEVRVAGKWYCGPCVRHVGRAGGVMILVRVAVHVRYAWRRSWWRMLWTGLRLTIRGH